jgi:hypothetical protein
MCSHAGLAHEFMGQHGFHPFGTRNSATVLLLLLLLLLLLIIYS